MPSEPRRPARLTPPQAILRHSGHVVCKGVTFCVTLEGHERRAVAGTVERQDAAIVASIDALSGIFGESYILEFIDDADVLAGAQARQLASDLVGWTVAAAVSVLLAHGDSIFGFF